MQVLSENGNLQQFLFQEPVVERPKIEHKYQDLGVRMQTEFGNQYAGRIWPLFWNAKYSVDKIEFAFEQYRKQPIKSFNYFMGILKRT